MNRRELGRRLVPAVLLLLGVAGAAATYAQSTFPSRPIKLLVGFAAGGPTDSAARMIADGMAKDLGQTVIVDNRPGANSQLAVMELLRSKPDGYTILLASNGSLTVGPARYSKLPYDVKRDFTLVGPVVAYPHMLVVPIANPATDFASFLGAAKARSEGINAASVGHVNDLTIEWLNTLAKVRINRIPYKGDSAVVSDLVAGRVDMALLAPNVAQPLVQGRKVKAIALTAQAGVSALNQLRTIKESGLPDFEVEIWNSLVAPAGTPADVVRKLADSLQKAQQTPEIQSKLALTGQHPQIGSAEDLARKIERETVQWRTIVREAKLPLLDQ